MTDRLLPPLIVHSICYKEPAKSKRPWAWELWRTASDPGVSITSSPKYKTRESAESAARRWLKERGLKEHTWEPTSVAKST